MGLKADPSKSNSTATIGTQWSKALGKRRMRALQPFYARLFTLRTSDIPNVDKVYSTFKIYHQDKTDSIMETIVEDIITIQIFHQYGAGVKKILISNAA